MIMEQVVDEAVERLNTEETISLAKQAVALNEDIKTQTEALKLIKAELLENIAVGEVVTVGDSKITVIESFSSTYDIKKVKRYTKDEQAFMKAVKPNVTGMKQVLTMEEIDKCVNKTNSKTYIKIA